MRSRRRDTSVRRLVQLAPIVLAISCNSPTPAPTAPKSDPVVPGDAAVAIDTASSDAGAAPPIDAAIVSVPGDPPEPVAPQVECSFERTVFCITGTPTRVALQPSPFEWCARTQPARQQSFYKLDAQFSAAETRAARKTHADACCYVDFSTRACD